MFNAKPEQSQALNDQRDRERVALADIKSDQDRKLYGNAMVVKAFNQIAQGKNDAAEASLASVAKLTTMTLSTILLSLPFAAKKGQAARAIDFSLKTAEVDPRFAWVYRTIGFLRMRWLKDNAGAEQALAEALKIEPFSSERETC